MVYLKFLTARVQRGDFINGLVGIQAVPALPLTQPIAQAHFARDSSWLNAQQHGNGFGDLLVVFSFSF